MDDRPSNKIEAMHVRGAIPTSVRVSKACTQTIVFLNKEKKKEKKEVYWRVMLYTTLLFNFGYVTLPLKRNKV